MLVGTLYLGYVFDVHHIMSILEYILDHNAKPDIWDYFKAMGVGWLVENDHSFFAGLHVHNNTCLLVSK